MARKKQAWSEQQFAANQAEAESNRISSIEKAESAGRPGLPQMLRDQRDREVYADQWGVTREQLEAILDELLEIEGANDWDVYQFVDNWVKKKTFGTGLGYALLKNSREPKEVNVMVSHSWKENVVDFLRAIVRSTTDKDVMFICFLSIYQNEDGEGPSISAQIGDDSARNPFKSVLGKIRERGSSSTWSRISHQHLGSISAVPQFLALLALSLLYFSAWHAGCLSSFRYCYTKREHHGGMFHEMRANHWDHEPASVEYQLAMLCATASALLSLVSFLLLKTVDSYRGRMIVCPNADCDIYTRLWCVYEIFSARTLGVPVRLAKSLASIGIEAAQNAVCTKDEDEVRIKAELEYTYGSEQRAWKKINTAIWWIAISSHWECIQILLRWGTTIILLGVARFSVARGAPCAANAMGVVLGIATAIVFILMTIRKVAAQVNGSMTVMRCLALSALFLVVAIVVHVLHWASGLYHEHGLCRKSGDLGACLEGFMVTLFAGCYSACGQVILFACYGYTIRDQRRFNILWREMAFLLGCLLVYVVVSTPRHQWKKYDHAWPEALHSLCTFCAIALCPMYALYTFALSWDIRVVAWRGRSRVATQHGDEAADDQKGTQPGRVSKDFSQQRPCSAGIRVRQPAAPTVDAPPMMSVSVGMGGSPESHGA